MKITTWNLRHGGGKRIKKIISALKNEPSDVIILTEYRNNKNSEELKKSLSELGYIHQYWFDSEPRINSVIIVSKQEFENKENFPILKEHQQRVLKVRVNGYNIYGCYFPGKELKKEVFEFLLSEINTRSKENIIITGDINTGKHFIDEKGASFYHSEYLDKFESKGLIDAWRKVNEENKEFSWYSNAGNGFRLDHFFIDVDLADNIINCEYRHIYREDKISDHSLMSLELMKTKIKSTKKKEKKVDFRSKFPANIRTNDGHLVRSRAEAIIDNTLYNYGLVHAYERKLPITEIVYSDFYIPALKGSQAVYIEFWGFENEPRYLKRKRDKKDIYDKYNLNLIEIDDKHIENLDDHLPRMLLEFGINVE